MSHSDKAALRGEPSYVWRSGQERRLEMLAKWTKLEQARVLDSGGGNGMYGSQILRRYQAEMHSFDIEWERSKEAVGNGVENSIVSVGEFTPYPSNYFDTILSNEVIEHVQDDKAAIREMFRTLKIGGRIAIFCPNRWYPFEQHGYYWNGEYHFGNTPLINYLPDVLRDKLAPHVRAYTKKGLLDLFTGLPVKQVYYARIYGGYDNLIPRLGKPMIAFREWLYSLEGSVLDTWGLSHWLVMEKLETERR